MNDPITPDELAASIGQQRRKSGRDMIVGATVTAEFLERVSRRIENSDATGDSRMDVAKVIATQLWEDGWRPEGVR